MKNDLIGQKFGRLLVLEVSGSDKHKKTIYRCKCDCGNITESISGDIKRGHTKSCGCLNVESITKHNSYNTRLYRTWSDMGARCNNVNDTGYKHYGGRGITVCAEWTGSFEWFQKWSLENGYRDDLTIDRIDFNGNYEPSNCRWATQKQQQRNKRTSIFIEINGERLNLMEVAEIYNLDYCMLKYRNRVGIKFPEIISPSGSIGRTRRNIPIKRS